MIKTIIIPSDQWSKIT